MSNISISEITTEITTLNDDDLLLVSKNNGSDYTSAKMKGSVLKNSGTQCQASTVLNSYGAAKSSDITSAKNAIQSSISNLNNISSSDVKTACESVMSSSSTSVNVKGVFIDPSKSDGFQCGSNSLVNYTLLYDSVITMWIDVSQDAYSQAKIELIIGNMQIGSITGYSQIGNSGSQSFYLKKGAVITIACTNYSKDTTHWSICPLG